MIRSYWFALLAIAALHLPSIAQAQRSIGIHFPSDRDNARLEEDEIAGLLPQGFWNNADGGTINAGENGTRFNAAGDEGNNVGDTTNITLPDPNLAGFLFDSTGTIAANEATATPTSVSWQSNGTWNTTNGTATPNHKLMNGYIDAFTNAGLPEGVRVSFEDIPYSSYDVIVYVGTDGNDRQGNAVFCDAPTCTEDFQPSIDFVEAFADAGLYREWSTMSNFGAGEDIEFQLITSDQPGTREAGNYFVAPGLTSTTFTVEIVNWTGGNDDGIHAVQIVENVIPPANCDFDQNGVCEVADIDGLLYTGIPNQDLIYDMDGNGTVDLADRDAWLIAAGNRESVGPYVTGDTDLDGRVNAPDLNNLGVSWTSTTATSWLQGDFNGDANVNAVDLNEIGRNWQFGVAAAATVPEPSGLALLLTAFMVGLTRRRRR